MLPLPFIFAVSNALRGSKTISKAIAPAIWAITISLHLSFVGGYDLWQLGGAALASFLGFWAALAPGWGIGFSAFHGRIKAGEVEISWLDKIVDTIVRGAQSSPAKSRKWGVWWMTLRGLFFYPAFIALSLITGQYWLLLTGLIASLSMGLVYGAMRYVHEGEAVRLAEFVFGGLIGCGVLYGMML